MSGTTSETTIIGSGVGSLSVPASGFSVGDSFRCIVSGDLGANNNDTLTLRVKTDSVVLGTTGAINLPGVTNKHFNFDIHFIKMDEYFNKKLSDFIGCDIFVSKKNLMEREYLKIKNHEICYKIFNDYCLRQKKFIDIYNQDYLLYNSSK